MTKLYVNDVGSDIILETGLTLTGAISLKIIGRKPDFTEFEWDASIQDTTSVFHTTLVDDLDQPGIWTVQSSVEMSDGKWLGESVSFEVFRKFN